MQLERNVERQEGGVDGADYVAIGKAKPYTVVSGKLIGAGGGGSKEMASAARI